MLVHNFLDSSKAHFADMRHRAIFHNSMGPYVAERIFGIPNKQVQSAAERFGWSEEEVGAVLDLIKFSKTEACTSFRNSDDSVVEVRDVAEAHIIEDLGRIPTVGDYLSLLPLDPGFFRQGARKTIGKGNNP